MYEVVSLFESGLRLVENVSCKLKVTTIKKYKNN